MYTTAAGDRICALLAEGKSLRKAAAACGTTGPSVMLWTEQHTEFGLQYARARLIGYQMRADTLLDTAADESIDPASRRIIVDAQKWELSKMLPKVYGDKLDVTAQVTASVIIKATPQDEAL